MIPIYIAIIAIVIVVALLIIYSQYQSNNRIKAELAEQERIVQSLHTDLVSKQAELLEHERESAQSKALFSIISNVSYDFVLVLDETNTLITYNQSAEVLFGDRNPIGENIHNLLDVPDLEDIIQRAVTETETLEEQFAIGKQFYRARTQVIHYGDKSYFVGLAIQDITQLVRLNRARRDMVANISHELRTPITKIRFVIDSLFYDEDRPKRKASIHSLHEISYEVGALEDVVQELLDLSMIESGQSIMKLVEEPLYEIAQAAVERLHEKLEDKEISVVRHIPETMRTLCDRDHVRRVMTNLISNAIKWSPRKQIITISAENMGEDIKISVVDDGPGVPDDQCERIFERFYQIDTARSGGEGSGLGLALCKHIVEAHGGKIWAEGNSQGNGGRFNFTLLNAVPVANDDQDMDRLQDDAEFMPTASIDK